MPSQAAPLQINQFIGGLNTESSPLLFPDNASSDELNIEINKDGTRSQRFGLDVENGFVSVDTTIPLQSGEFIGRSEFRWYNPGGLTNQQILIVQIGNYLGFHKIGSTSLSSSKIYSKVMDVDTYGNIYSYAVVDGILVVADGSEKIHVFEWDGVSISYESRNLLIRDLFGVDAIVDGVDLTDESNWSVRPSSKTKNHIYNLRNQTFALPRLTEDDTTDIKDPIAEFRSATGNSSNLFPSNADNLNRFFAAEPSFTNLPRADRYLSSDNYKFKPGQVRAPQGQFIINAILRGQSRQVALDALYSNNPDLTITQGLESFKEDRTVGGPTVVVEYAGRVWYLGFSSDNIDPEGVSPRMGSYLLFSQSITDKRKINRCFSARPATNPYDPDVVESDGGFIRLSGVTNIVGALNLGASLFIFADNGIWEISGTDKNVFSATSFSVSKISDFGCIAGNSIVQVGASAMYWGQDGIYQLTQEESTLFGTPNYKAEVLTEDNIKTFYENIVTSDKKTVVGYHDVENNSVRWLYGTDLNTEDNTKELVFNLKYGAFTPNSLTTNGELIGVISSASGFSIVEDKQYDITVSGVQVTSDGDDVYIIIDDVEITPYGSFYCMILSTDLTIKYTFGGYVKTTHFDWVRLSESTGYMPECYLQTGPVTGNEGRLRKDVPYLTIHFPNKGADGISCLFSAYWGWSTDVSTGRWSSLRQGYRYIDHFNNLDVVSTRNKVRGSGRSVSFKFENSDDKPLHLFGWEFNLAANIGE